MIESISIAAFSDEMQKIAASKGYRKPTFMERMGPGFYLGNKIPLDPEERAAKYRRGTKYVPAIAGAAGAGLGYLAGRAGGLTRKMSLIPAAGAGAIGVGSNVLGRREMIKRMREKAILEQHKKGKK